MSECFSKYTSDALMLMLDRLKKKQNNNTADKCNLHEKKKKENDGNDE